MSALVIFKAAPGSYYIEREDVSALSEFQDMPAVPPSSADLTASTSVRRCLAWLDALVRRWPFAAVLLLIFGSNAFGSVFNIGYNRELIVNRLLDETQQAVFHDIAFPLYNLIVYPIGLGITVWLIVPVARSWRLMRRGQTVPLKLLELARKRLVNLPFYQVCLNLLGWLPGAFVFPLLVCALGGNHEAAAIWSQFIVSFVVSALLTTAQTFFLLEWFLKRYFYDDFFKDARPAAVQGMIRIPFKVRMAMLWSALAVPLVALWLVAVNLSDANRDTTNLQTLALLVMVIGGSSGLFIFWLVGSDLWKWVEAHETATEQVELGNFEVHVQEQRPDEWGQLTDRFNDMVAALARAKYTRELLGQIVSPEVRDDLLQNFPGLGGETEEITVLFADIRGFTRRTAGKDPTRVVELLNRFLTLATIAVESRGGLIDKYLGDGVMALFGARRRNVNHADQAVAAAQDLLSQTADSQRRIGCRR